MNRRLVAVGASLGLVLAAIGLRAALSAESSSDSDKAAGPPPVVACVAELQDVCELLAEAEVISEVPTPVEYGTEQARTAAVGEKQIDAWIAWNPSGQMVNEAERADIWAEPVPLASAPVKANLSPRSAWPTPCQAADFEWSCLPKAVQDQRQVTVAVGDPNLVSGLVRLWPIASQTVPEGEFDDPAIDQVVELIKSPQRDSTTVAEDLNAFALPGNFQILVGPPDSTSTPASQKAVSVPPLSIAVFPRAGTSARWAEQEPTDELRAFFGTLELTPVHDGFDLNGPKNLPAGMTVNDWAESLIALRSEVTEQ